MIALATISGRASTMDDPVKDIICNHGDNDVFIWTRAFEHGFYRSDIISHQKMASISKLSVIGVQSFSPDDEEQVIFILFTSNSS